MITRTVSEGEVDTTKLPSAEQGLIIKGTWCEDPDVIEYYMCVWTNHQRLWVSLKEGHPMQDPEPWNNPVSFPAPFEYIGIVEGPVTLSTARKI